MKYLINVQVSQICSILESILFLNIPPLAVKYCHTRLCLALILGSSIIVIIMFPEVNTKEEQQVAQCVDTDLI